MSYLYSLRVRANQSGAPWRDVTSSLDVTQLPSISINAEQQGGLPLVAAASDLSLTVHNDSGVWDRIFDAALIVGTLPPVEGETVRAPAAHYGAVLLSRFDTSQSVWQVLFFGFVSAGSVKFNRLTRTCTFTAYGPAKLLESGNAERVNRFYNLIPPSVGNPSGGLARPFIVPVDPLTGHGAIQHPALAGGDPASSPTTTTTTLNGNITSSAVTLTVASATNFPALFFVIQIGSELIQVNTVSGNVFNVTRGILGTSAASHTSGDTVTLMSSALSGSWWLMVGGNTAPVIPLLAGDTFQVISAIPATAWIEGMATVPLVSTTFTIKSVAAVGADLYFETTEASSDAALTLGGFTAGIEMFEPWYRSRDWKALIDGSDGNPNCLEAEVNEALATLGVTDAVSFLIPPPPELPLLVSTAQLFSQPIFQPDTAPGCMGVSYGLYSGTPFLAHQRTVLPAVRPVFAKPDILKADSVAGVFAPFAPLGTGRCGSNLYGPTPIAGYQLGPDDGKPVRLLSSTINDQLDATPPPDYATDDLPIGGQALHAFTNLDAPLVATPILSRPTFDSTHWCRAPSSYRSGTSPKRLYRIYARGRYLPGPGPGLPTFRKGIEIDEVTTPDEGATWTIVATDENFTVSTYPDDGTPVPLSSRSSRPSIKVFELTAASAFLYVWVDPILSAAYCYESATDNVAPATLMGASPFIAAGLASSPILSSSAVHWPDGTATGTTLFFCDRGDGVGVDVYYYAPGPTWALATVVNATGVTLPVGADWINAVTDTSRTPTRLYVMAGTTLYAMRVSFAAGTLTILAAQAIKIDQVNYSILAESTAHVLNPPNPNAIAWLTCPVTQAGAGEPDYNAASDALIIGTSNAVYVLSNTAANIVDVADFTGLSVAAALAALIVLRVYLILSSSDKDLVPDPDLYANSDPAVGPVNTPIPTVSFYARLETAARAALYGRGVVDITAATEQIVAGTWLQLYQSIQVGNSKAGIGPAYSATGLTNLDGKTFTINPLRNAASAALQIDNPFISTVSFCQLLANLFAQEFVVPRPSATLLIRDPYSRGYGFNLYPGMLVNYLLTPPDSINAEAEQQGRVLTVDYALDTGLVTLGVA